MGFLTQDLLMQMSDFESYIETGLSLSATQFETSSGPALSCPTASLMPR